jgi:hypothetical protein
MVMRYRDIPSCLIEQICTSISDEQKFKFPDSQKDQLARLRRYYEGLSKTINEIKGLFYCLSGETLILKTNLISVIQPAVDLLCKIPSL